MSKKLNPSWERTRNETHSMEGVDDLRKNLRAELTRKYLILAQSMFEYNMKDIDRFRDILRMSRDKAPERWLVSNGQVCAFDYEGQILFLPIVQQGGLNICGEITGWSPLPAGYEDNRHRNPVFEEIASLTLDWENSVLWSNNRFNQGDRDIIDSHVALLLDNILTVNQLQLLAKAPFIMEVTEDQLMDAKNMFLSICQDRPVIYTNKSGEKLTVVHQTGVKMDPALLDIFRHWENLLLEALGIPGSVQNTKRAQQSVDEINMAEDKTSMIRHDKLLQRQNAVDRMNELWDLGLTVTSVIDSQLDDERDGEDYGEEEEDDVQ